MIATIHSDGTVRLRIRYHCNPFSNYFCAEPPESIRKELLFLQQIILVDTPVLAIPQSYIRGPQNPIPFFFLRKVSQK